MNENTVSNRIIVSRRAAIAGISIGASMLVGCAAGRRMDSRPEARLKQLSPQGRSTVVLRAGSDRRKIAYKSLLPFRDEVAEAVAGKKVVLKVNAGTVKAENAVYSTHPDHIRAILDFLKPIYDRPVMISEGTSGGGPGIIKGYENYGYLPIASEYDIEFIDANEQPSRQVWLHSSIGQPVPVNIVETYVDPDVYLISAPRMKTHAAAVATLSAKNVIMGSPQANKPWMHGGKFEKGYRGKELSYNLFNLALAGVQPDLAAIDGFEAIEGNGPWAGDVIKHGIAISSTDFVAADMFGTVLMGIDPFYMKYLEWCGNAGMGNFSMDRIIVDGPDYQNHIREYIMPDRVRSRDSVGWIEDNFDRR